MRTYFKNQKNKLLSGSRRRRSDAASELKLIRAAIHLNRSAKLGFGKIKNDPNVKIIDAPIHIERACMYINLQWHFVKAVRYVVRFDHLLLFSYIFLDCSLLHT